MGNELLRDPLGSEGTKKNDILSAAFELAASRGRVLQTGDEALDVVEAAVQHRHVLLVAFARSWTGVVVDVTHENCVVGLHNNNNKNTD